MKRVSVSVIVSLFFVSAALAGSALTPYQRTSRFEFGFWGGFALGSGGGSIAYASTWTAPPAGFRLVEESGTIDPKSRWGAGIGASAAFFPSPNLGLEASLGFAYTDAPNTGAFTLTRADLPLGLERASGFSWPGCGSLISLPISLDLIVRFGAGRWGGYASLGPTLFLHSYSAQAHLGLAVARGAVLDAVKIGLETGSKTWLAPGGNAGAGLFVRLTPMLNAVLDVRYYLCPAKTLDWEALAGSYPGLLHDGLAFQIGETEASLIRDRYGLRFEVKPSFFQASAGVKLRI